MEQPRASPDHVHRRVRKSPWRLLVPVLIGLALLSWALELGKDRERPTGEGVEAR